MVQSNTKKSSKVSSQAKASPAAMDAKLKRKWVKALRGGEYQRGKNRLVADAGEHFCCLGVLADIQGCRWLENGHGELHPIMPRAKEIFSAGADGDPADGEYLQPRRAGGLDIKVQMRLARMNDKGASFNRIADYIEQNL